ncbi:hypothetical protein DPMN_084296 [Dreissena polymorpha]|uniref:Uncharacterized protein n=1 Tax=Dreissena polymorpha TaxID=45954 RepID=A0A9D4BKQ8_DREPO|nr:hypothetical protein DPMN_084296 [Dreissena polymorpha]
MDLENLIDMTGAEADALLHSDSEAPKIEKGSKDPETCQEPEVLVNALSKMGHPTAKRPRHRARYRKRQRSLVEVGMPASHCRCDCLPHSAAQSSCIITHPNSTV